MMKRKNNIFFFLTSRLLHVYASRLMGLIDGLIVELIVALTDVLIVGLIVGTMDQGSRIKHQP